MTRARPVEVGAKRLSGRPDMQALHWKQIAIPMAYVFLLGVIAVFVHSGLQGDHGLAAYHEAGEEERRLQHELETLQAERAELGNRVSRLSRRNLDLDLLDERARDGSLK